MKDKTIQLIERLEHQYRPYGLSEKFHDATSTQVKRKELDPSLWPKIWKTIHFKSYPRLNSIMLKKDFSSGMKVSFDKVLYKRISTREYKNKQLTTKILSTLLFFSSGIKSIMNDDWSLSRRFYPSGGARYPLEVYVVLYNNTELEKGIYHYNVKQHSLEILERGDFTKELQEGLSPTWMSNANMTIFITSVFGRNQTKYGERGYRLILAESGHLAQNVCLIASALNLGCCALGGYIDSVTNNMLDVDGVNESVIYSMIIGFPKDDR